MIYADNAATTRIFRRAFEQMLPFLHDQFGNASSGYSLGANARRAITLARQQIAIALGAKPSEIIFTSGGSETNNWVLRCIAETFRNDHIHIITSAIEHHSVLNTCRMLEHSGVEVTMLPPVDETGRISANCVRSAIKPNTKLVSIMLANNEIGTIQPISEIGSFLREEGILFHTDAVQAVGHIPVNVDALHVDFLTASAHKFNGAKGTGILYKRSSKELLPFVLGGEQEYGLRAGTENVAGIVAAGYAIEESIKQMNDTAKRLKHMVDNTIKGIRKRIPSVREHGSIEYRLPGIINLGFDGILGESLMHLLDLKDIQVSTGSACTSGKNIPSHVLMELGLTDMQAKSAIRISYGCHNTINEVDSIVDAICDSFEKIIANN